MKKLFAIVTGALLLASSAMAAESEGWLTDYQEGLAAVRKNQKNMMVLFTGSDWCIWCKRLQADILRKEEFKSFAKENLVLVELDFPRENKPSEEIQAARRALAEKYGIRGYPTIVLLTPEEKDFGRMGYQEKVDEFLEKYKSLAAEVTKEAAAPEAPLDFKYTINIQYKDAPEMEGWMKAMQALCNEWYPKIVAELNSPGFKPYPEVNLTVRSDPRGVAGTGGRNIFLSREFFTRNGTDAGAVIHELTHVVQAYPKYIPWITEAIADYIRLYVFEPNAPRPPVNPEKATLKDGYKSGAAFMAWLVEKKDPQIIKKLNTALRQGTYEDELFKELTQKTVDELFAEFLESLK
ncbi:MAG TPA: basic secretory protein-like protein [Verrucomicrobiota bacterium]|jgi:thioredoxin-related protein|nr:basic secretory protein-like protein [Verrucomicrobiota bacterium]